jgi:signal transduction histidine kinase
MCQILHNIVGNAIKFTPKGIIEISAEVVSGDGQEDMVAVKVQDTGIGLSQNDILAIFSPFVQGNICVYVVYTCICSHILSRYI